jgi:hypothetical protein
MLSLYYTQFTCINWLPKPSYFRIGFLWIVVLLSPVVMSVIQVFPSLWCWVWLVLSVESVSLPSVVMWGHRGEVRCCGLSNDWNGGEGCDLHSLWLVKLKCAKDRVLGVDTPGQLVPPCVRYETACLLIRDVVGSVLLGWVRIWSSYSPRLTWCKRGRGTTTTPRNLSNAIVLCTTLTKPGIRPVVNLHNSM